MDHKRTIESRVTEVSPFLDSFAELERHIAAAHKLRARATADMLAAAGRAVARPVRAIGARIAHQRRARQTYQALAGRDDRALADIGIERGDIALIAKGIDPRAGVGRRPWWTRYRELRLRLEAALRARRQWRRVKRELMAYDDRELDEVGIRRSDIPEVARGRVVAPAIE